jgi:hypothetical protein
MSNTYTDCCSIYLDGISDEEASKNEDVAAVFRGGFHRGVLLVLSDPQPNLSAASSLNASDVQKTEGSLSQHPAPLRILRIYYSSPTGPGGSHLESRKPKNARGARSGHGRGSDAISKPVIQGEGVRGCRRGAGLLF